MPFCAAQKSRARGLPNNFKGVARKHENFLDSIHLPIEIFNDSWESIDKNSAYLYKFICMTLFPPNKQAKCASNEIVDDWNSYCTFPID